MINISNIEEALYYVNALINNEIEPDLDINFTGELEHISIKITGNDFHHSITGELARGIASFQDEIYKAAKFAIYGREGRIQLPPELKNHFEFNFTVNEGSSELDTPTNTIATGLSSGISHMDSKHLSVTIILSILFLATAYTATSIYASYSKQQEETASQTNQTAQISKVVDGFVDLAKTLQSAPEETKKVVNRVREAATEGKSQLLRSVPNAEKVSINGVSFDQRFISELRARAPRSQAESVDVFDTFKVYADTNIDPIRLTLSGSVIPGEFYADFPDDIDSETSARLWSTIQTKGELEMHVRITILRDKLKGGVILEIPKPKNT